MNYKDFRRRRGLDFQREDTPATEQTNLPPQPGQINMVNWQQEAGQPKAGTAWPTRTSQMDMYSELTPSTQEAELPPVFGEEEMAPAAEAESAVISAAPTPTLPPVIDRMERIEAGREPGVDRGEPSLPPAITPEEAGTAQTGMQMTPQDTGIQDKGDEAFQMYMDYAMQEEDPMVTAERRRLDRNNLLRAEQAKRLAHERAIQAGYQPGTPQYEQMMRNAISDSQNQNIAATNAFNDFQRARRAERQQELMNIYKEGVKADERAWELFEDIVKFLPSLTAQEGLLRAQLGGVSLSETIQNMYGTDGRLKQQYRDLTRAQLVKQGITDAVNEMQYSPDGDAWKNGEKERYVEEFYQENFENILYPSERTTEQRKEEDLARDRVDTFLETGDYSGMQPEDWKFLTASQKEDAKKDGYMVNYKDVEHQWSGKPPARMSTADAIAAMEKAYPDYTEGMVIDKGGKLYTVVGWQQTAGDWSAGRGQLYRVALVVKPVDGGDNEILYKSRQYNP